MGKISVTLRKRERASGKVTLYLDIYANGERKVENLHLFLLPGTDSKTKQHNKNIMAAAETMRSRTYMEYVDGMAYKNKKSRDVKIGEYIDKILASKSDVSNRYHDEFLRAKALFIETAGDLKLSDITADTIRAYIKTLNTTDNHAYKEGGHLLSNATKHALYSRINHVLIRAVKEGIIPSNPAAQLDSVEKPKKKSKEREFLTLEEVQLLANTPCPSDRMLKEAFLFCCFTGLRISDIHTLTWDMIEGGKAVKQQIKTGQYVQIPLSANALRWLPERGDADGGSIIFKDLFTWQASVNRAIGDWTKKAGIKKKVTFHSSRHTFATLLLNNGADIFTTSKLLGHTNIATTQIYAHLLDKRKEEAVSLIPELDLTK